MMYCVVRIYFLYTLQIISINLELLKEYVGISKFIIYIWKRKYKILITYKHYTENVT